MGSLLVLVGFRRAAVPYSALRQQFVAGTTPSISSPLPNRVIGPPLDLQTGSDPQSTSLPYFVGGVFRMHHPIEDQQGRTL